MQEERTLCRIYPTIKEAVEARNKFIKDSGFNNITQEYKGENNGKDGLF